MNVNKHNDTIKTTLFLKTVIINFCLFWVFNVRGDSSFIDNKIWDISTNKLVLETGENLSSQHLNQSHIDFFLDKEISLFDKIAMVNAIGRTRDSVSLAEGYLNPDRFLEILTNRKYESGKYADPVTNFYEFAFNDIKLEFNLMLVYFYMYALEHDTSEERLSSALEDIQLEIDLVELANPQIIIDKDFPYLYRLVRSLIQSQLWRIKNPKNGLHCSVIGCSDDYYTRNLDSAHFDGEISKDLIQNIQKVLVRTNTLNRGLNDSCENIHYNLRDYIFIKDISIAKTKSLWFQNYPEFVYGIVTVLDFNNKIVSKSVVDGGDYIEIDLKNLIPGQYTIEAQGEPKEREKLEHRSIGTKIYKVSLTVTE